MKTSTNQDNNGKLSDFCFIYWLFCFDMCAFVLIFFFFFAIWKKLCLVTFNELIHFYFAFCIAFLKDTVYRGMRLKSAYFDLPSCQTIQVINVHCKLFEINKQTQRKVQFKYILLFPLTIHIVFVTKNKIKKLKIQLN